MKKFSKIKRIGVKSIHYTNNTVVAEDQFSKNTNLLFTAEYENIDTLDKCTDINVIDTTSNVKFKDLQGKNGFLLSSKIKDKNLKVRVKSVKKTSYIQEIFDISKENNIEIQIFNNLEDIKKIITPYFNNVSYTINSLYKDLSGDNSYTFDRIGSVPVDIDWISFSLENPKRKELWANEILPIYQKILKKFGFHLEKNKQINFIKCLQYIALKNGCYIKKKDGSTVDINAVLNPNQRSAVDKLISDRDVNAELFKLSQTPASEIYKDALSIPLFRYFFKDKRVEKIVLDKLSKNEYLKTLITTFDNNETAYNYLRILSAIRQFIVHNAKKIRIQKNIFINDIAKREVEDFSKSFAKSNYKYFCILKEISSEENILEQFFRYTIFDAARNQKVSIDKIKKAITETIDISSDVQPNSLSEYASKFRTIVMFLITKRLSENTEELNELIANIKICSSDEEKKEVYDSKAKELIKDFDEFKDIRAVIKKYIGSIKPSKQFDFYPTDIPQFKNMLFDMIYVMSKFLTNKEARIMFQKIKNKYESIKSLLEMADSTNTPINQELLGRYEMLLEDGVDNILNQLIILQSIRTRDSSATDSFSQELQRIFAVFKNDGISYEEFEKDLTLDENKRETKSDSKKRSFKLKPLKSYLRNDVYKSKQYQYISSFASTSICQKLMSNKNIIAFVLKSMISKDNKECIPMQRYIAKTYHDFKGENINENSADYLLNEKQITLLIDSLYNLKLESLIASIFGETKDNYRVLVKLYLNICYLFIKNIISMNSTYLIQLQDYEFLFRQINRENFSDISYDLSVVENFIKNTTNKKCRSYKQLQTLLEKDYVKDYVKSSEYQTLQNRYRNMIVHTSILYDLENAGYDFSNLDNITSFFAIYNTLVQTLFENEARAVWGDNYDRLFTVDNEKNFSTKLCIAYNIPYAYNISRFNNNTIEKYASKNR